jgi:hypothetical protein
MKDFQPSNWIAQFLNDILNFYVVESIMLTIRWIDPSFTSDSKSHWVMYNVDSKDGATLDEVRSPRMSSVCKDGGLRALCQTIFLVQRWRNMTMDCWSATLNAESCCRQTVTGSSSYNGLVMQWTVFSALLSIWTSFCLASNMSL